MGLPPNTAFSDSPIMKFSTKTTYGLRAMIYLAKNWGKKNVSLPTIASNETISLGYLERLFSRLKKANLVLSEKGSTGGYGLAKSPKKITIFNIIKALEGKITPFHCIGDDGKVYCDKRCGCGALIVLSKVQNAVNKTLKNIKLSDLI